MTGQRRLPASLCCAYLGILWLWTASSCWREWRDNSDYSYGWLVFPLSIYFAWKRLAPLPAGAPSTPAARVARLGLFLPALAALPLELLRLAPLYWLVVPWLIFFVTFLGTLSLAWLYGGTKWAVGALFPVILAATAVPWPTFLEGAINIRLMGWVAATVSDWLRLCGIPCERQGLVIFLPHCTIGIERACSGLRSVQASIMAALVAGELFALPVTRRVILLALSPYLALLANLARTFAISLIGFHGGEAAASAWHGTTGAIAMLGIVAAIIGVARLMRTAPRKPAPIEETRVSQPAPARVVLLAVICILVPLGAARAWYLLHAASQRDTPVLTAQTSDELPVPAEIQSELAPSEGVYLREEYPPFGTITGYHFFWRKSIDVVNQLYHRPDVCMPGAGWKPIAAPRAILVPVGTTDLDWHIFQYEQNGSKADLLWGAWLGGKQIPIALDSTMSLQNRLIWHLVSAGIQDATYEVAAVLVPRTGHPLTDAQAAGIIAHTFSLNANPPHR